MSKLVIPILVALLIAGIWWIADTGAPAPSADPIVDESSAEGEPAELIGTGTNPSPPPIPATSTSPATEPEAHPLVAPTRGSRLRGTVVGVAEADRVQDTEIQVQFLFDGWSGPDGQRIGVGHVDADGTIDLDLGPWLSAQKPSRSPSHLEVTADHSRYARVVQRVDISGRDLEETQVFEVRLQMHRAAAATGVVTDGRGDPIEGASVALFTMKDGAPRFDFVMPIQPADVTRTDAEGRYSVRVGASGAHVVVAAIRGRLPTSRRVTLTQPEETKVDRLVLDPGASISGTVRMFGEPPTEGYVTVTPADDPEGMGFLLAVGDEGVAWNDGDVVPGVVYTQTDKSGRYRVEGLPVGAASVHASAQSDAFDVVFPAVEEGFRREVGAPADGVDFDITGVRLLVRVVSGGEPVPMASVFLRDEMSSSMAADESGVSTFLVPHEHDFEVEVRADGYESRILKIRTGRSGEHAEVVELAPEAPRPSLVVVLKDASGAPVPKAAFEFHSPDSEEGTGMDIVSPEGVDGVFTLERMQPGRLVLIVMPWRDAWDDSGYGVNIHHEIVLPAVGEERIELVAQRGGRLRIAARNKAGGLVESTCVIRDADGEPQQVNFAMHTESMYMSQPEKLGTMAPSLIEPPLAPGIYTLEVTHEAWSKTVEVTVEADKTIDVDVVIEPD